MARYADVESFSKLFDAEYKKTRELIEQGETYLDNLAEGFSEAGRVIRNLPTADVVEVKHGEWVVSNCGLYVCSECDKTCPYDAQADDINYWVCKYCPHCGAKMDGRSDT